MTFKRNACFSLVDWGLCILSALFLGVGFFYWSCGAADLVVLKGAESALQQAEALSKLTRVATHAKFPSGNGPNKITSRANFELAPFYAKDSNVTAAAFRMGLRLRLRGLYSKLGLDESQIAALEYELSLDGPAFDGIEAAVRSMNDGGPLARRTIKNIVDRLVARAANVLDPGQVAEFKQAVLNSQLERVVSSVAVNASVTTRPLSVRDVEYLREVLGQCLLDGQGKDEVIALTQVNWEKVLRASAGRLSVDQLNTLSAIAAKVSAETEYRGLASGAIRSQLPGLSIPGL